MMDEPRPAEILASVAAFLREELLPALEGDSAFKTRVAAHALDLIGREISSDEICDESIHAMLVTQLGHEGAPAHLERELAEALGRGRLTLATPGISDLLFAMTERKLGVDQPNYPGLALARTLRDTNS